MNFNTPIDAGGTDLAVIIADRGGVLSLTIADDSTATHRVVPIDVWRRMFDEYLERGQVALRRGIEIDAMRRKISKLREVSDE